MIKYYTKLDKIPKNKTFINSVDIYFNSWVVRNGLSKQDESLLKLIDKSRFSDNGQVNTLITPFGVANYFQISTGCKALILLHHLNNKYVVNIQECGQNVIDYIFNNLNNIEVYSSSYKAIPIIKDGLLINGKNVQDLANLKQYWR